MYGASNTFYLAYKYSLQPAPGSVNIFIMERLRVGVVGVGHLGRIHARIYKQLSGCQLTAVCDTDDARLKEISQELGVAGFCEHRKLFGMVDAVSIATPARSHFAIASDFLLHNIHTLVEKPFTSDLGQADSLIKTAAKNKLILQVGHIERFNSAFAATKELIVNPRFIECHRLSPFPNRSLDIGVVLDVMIHDIDIVLGLVSSPVRRIDAVGIDVLTPHEDIANARITFKNGCVANLTASRVSDEVMRKIRIFQKNTYISLDYKEARACQYKKDGRQIIKSDLPIEKEQPLQKELASFLECVINNARPLVCGKTARDALSLALEIQKRIWTG